MTNEFFEEHRKREKRISHEQRRAWADDLLARLPDSLAYQEKCTIKARLAEQEMLCKLVEDWQAQQAESNDHLSS